MSDERKPDLVETMLMKWGLDKGKASLIKVLAACLAIGILFLQAGELFGTESWSGSGERPPNATLVTGSPSPGEEDELTRQERRIAGDLAEKLTLIRGAGKVRVMVTLESGPAIDVVKNTTVDQSTTTEQASDNSTRKTETSNTRSEHVFSKDGGGERPVVSRTSRPVVAGVLIVAEGARNAKIRAQLLDAATVALKVPANRIEVVPAGAEGEN
jgi:stage III sporulation protein AG